ncbi:MAG TPA: prephenate dehydrogenase/arogenate dehydrogenase family protein [Methylotenera sp.]|nr:prephenate dehydrogenase/arogenate dehydrogenase family protein [Methylotenera sp.]HPH04321.1 prephenate dehydrogenase/arogenate dehydrogenase family protein [Methylotenera sp.]HPM99875.1 prephenate dehydrogenase/arogenate dehydrogenase family protein [Methylotenera sp.]
MNKLVIFGVGLIGGSVALALKKAGAGTHIVGVGRSFESLQTAKNLGVIDSVETNIQAACKDADLILIAAPVAQTTAILQSIKPHLNTQTVITDAGSTKSDVLAAAKIVLGEQFNQFVGGHPIAGAEKSGVTAAKADLFVGKNVVLTPENLHNIQDDALQASNHAASHIRLSASALSENGDDLYGYRASKIARVADMWKTCGANVTEMSAENHDKIFAAVSHLPHLLAFALVDDIAKRPNAEQLFSFAASGFRDFTRIAGSHPEMWRDISLANKTALLSEITAFQTELTLVKNLLENNDGAGLLALFERASVARNAWAKNKQ